MLVVAWDTLYEAIPRIQAKEQLAAYTTAVLASASLDENGIKARDGILDDWRNLAAGGKRWLQGKFRSSTDFGGPNTPPGATRDDSWFPSMRAFGSKMKDVLGLGLRE